VKPEVLSRVRAVLKDWEQVCVANDTFPMALLTVPCGEVPSTLILCIPTVTKDELADTLRMAAHGIEGGGTEVPLDNKGRMQP
jgi:hypothetical protein